MKEWIECKEHGKVVGKKIRESKARVRIEKNGEAR